MRILLLYYSNNSTIRELCEESARENKVDVMELRDRYDRSPVWCATVGNYKAVCGTGARIEDIDFDLEQYDSVILASPVWSFNPPPAVNEFLHRTNFSGKEVSGLLIHPGKSAGKAGDVLRNRIKLAGGVCCGIVSIPQKELQEKQNDIFSYLKLRFQRAL